MLERALRKWNLDDIWAPADGSRWRVIDSTQPPIFELETPGGLCRQPTTVSDMPTSNERNWPTGSYMGTCHACREVFMGQKREMTCRLCATPAPPLWSREQRIALEQRGYELVSEPAAPGALPPMPETDDRQPFDAGPAFVGYLESDKSWAERNYEAVDWLVDNHKEIRAALAALHKIAGGWTMEALEMQRLAQAAVHGVKNNG